MISRQSALAFINNILGALIGYAALFFVIRYMGKDALGTVAFAIAFVGLFSFIANLGFDTTHIKRVSEGKDLGRCNGTYLAIKLVLIGMFVLAVLIALYIWKYVLGNGFETRTHEAAVYLAIVYWAIFSGLYFFISTFNGRREIAKSQTLIFTNNFTRSALMIVVAALSIGTLALVDAYIAGVLLALMLAVFMFRKMPVSRPTKRYLSSYIRFAIPLSIASSVIVIASNTDVVMIQWFWSAADVADYYAAKRIGMLLTMISIAVSVALFPSLSHLHSKGRLEDVKKTTVTAERYISMLMFPLAFFIITFPDKIMSIMLSKSMLSSAPTLQILTLFYALIVINSPYNYQLPAIGRTDIIGKVNLTRALINIGLNLIFIPKSFMGVHLLGMGAFGAALATFITFLITTINLRWASYRLTGSVMDRRILLHISSAMLASIAFLLLGTSWVHRWYSLTALGMAYLALYFGILYALREFRKEDLEMFLDALSPKEMVRYIHKELKNK